MRYFSEAKQEHKIIDETRRSIIDALLAMGSLTGDKEYHEFAKLVCPSLSEGTVKNIIFAARYKPEIVFDDALNNDIRITKNADRCLIYDRPIPQSGLLWSELVEWFSAKTGTVNNVENCLLRRLCDIVKPLINDQN